MLVEGSDGVEDMDWGDPVGMQRRALSQGWRMSTPGLVAKEWLHASWPEFARQLTQEDFDTAVDLLARRDNKKKWSGLAAFVAKAGMGTVSPASLAADYRKWQANEGHPENQDLGGADPEK